MVAGSGLSSYQPPKAKLEPGIFDAFSGSPLLHPSRNPDFSPHQGRSPRSSSKTSPIVRATSGPSSVGGSSYSSPRAVAAAGPPIAAPVAVRASPPAGALANRPSPMSTAAMAPPPRRGDQPSSFVLPDSLAGRKQ